MRHYQNFTVVVDAEYNTEDFLGKPSGTDTHHIPEGGGFITSQYEIPTFYVLSSTAGNNIAIKIYHNGTLIDTVTADYQGKPLTTYNGKLLEVRINYLGVVTVTVIHADWGQESVWKDFQ